MKPKPFLKWAGGKTQLLPEILKHVPDKIDTYFEPFLGGGAVFFELYNRGLIKNAILTDVNHELILTWRAIQFDLYQVISSLQEKKNDKDFFYDERGKDYTKRTFPDNAARMIYLNKTCFNGLYRVNKKGGFNVPFGKYKNPTICNVPLLRSVQDCLRKIKAGIFCTDFERIERWLTPRSFITPKSFVYIDSPYYPLNKNSFVSYTSGGFALKDHERLAAFMFRLKEKNIKALLSNSDCKATRTLYNRLNIYTVEARRRINRDATKRGPITELLVRNY